MQTERLKVTGMTCGGCTSHVTRALEAIPGVTDVKVSLATGEASVEYDERVAAPDQLRSAVEGAGFGVNVTAVASGSPSKSSCCH